MQYHYNIYDSLFNTGITNPLKFRECLRLFRKIVIDTYNNAPVMASAPSNTMNGRPSGNLESHMIPERDTNKQNRKYNSRYVNL